MPILSQSSITEFIPKLYESDEEKNMIIEFIKKSPDEQFDNFSIQMGQIQKQIRIRREGQHTMKGIRFSMRDVLG